MVREQTTENHYEEYFTLRLVQAQSHLRTLIIQHGTSGWSSSAKLEIDRAIQRVDVAKQELKTQCARTAAAHTVEKKVSNSIAIRRLSAIAGKEW